MLVVQIYFFALIAALIVPPLSSSQVSESRSKWTRSRRWLWSTPPPPFFAGDKRPEGLPDISRGTEIEQKLPSDPPNTPPYFVSVFDATRNIPFYSAYKVTPSQAVGIGTHNRPNVNWRNPKDAKGRGIPVDAAYREAINTDGQPLSRGHMNPSGINSFDIDFMKATFTLTNAAPQFETSNSGPWQTFEGRISKYARSTCGVGSRSGTLYLLTGTSNFGLRPGGGKPVQDTTIPLPYTRIAFPRGVTLVTPRAVWTAGCCVWKEPGKIFGSWWPRKKAESFAVMSNNQQDRRLLHQTEMRVTDLEALLTKPGSPGVNLFPGDGNCRKNNVILPP